MTGKTCRKGNLFIVILGMCFFTFLLVSPAAVYSQSSAQDAIRKVLQKPVESRNSLMVLQFGATGLTESASRAFSNMIAQNLKNTHRFDIINPAEAEKIIAKEDPSLLPCFDIGCGIQMGNILGADRVLAGHLSINSNGSFNLSVKLVYIFDNSMEFEDTIRFDDNNMDRRFYQLSTRIAENTPMTGKIMEANNKLAVISLGERNGIQVGDSLVIYRNKALETPDGVITEKGIRRKNIGILRITKVGEESSEGIYFQSIETPQTSQFVTTFLDKRKQIRLIDSVRKELDTHERNVYEIKKVIKIAPIRLEDIEKKKWIRKIRFNEVDRDFWQTVLIGTGVSTAYFITQYKDGDGAKLMISLGAFGYSTLEYFIAKNKIKELLEDGKFKGFLDLNIRPDMREGRIIFRMRF